jgi:site-specific DNA-methyltransferase (adenine-specific)
MGTLYYGDNLEILRRYLKDASVDLVYLDPPFNSAQSYNAFFQEKDGPPPPVRFTPLKTPGIGTSRLGKLTTPSPNSPARSPTQRVASVLTRCKNMHMKPTRLIAI